MLKEFYIGMVFLNTIGVFRNINAAAKYPKRHSSPLFFHFYMGTLNINYYGCPRKSVLCWLIQDFSTAPAKFASL